MGKYSRMMQRKRKKQRGRFEEEKPQFKSKFANSLSRILTFFTYNDQCSALRMVCHDPLYYMHKLGWDAYVTTGVGQFTYLPWLVVNRIGIAQWDPQHWEAISSAIDIWKNKWSMEKQGKLTFYLDDLLLKGREEMPAAWGILDSCDQMVTANEVLRAEFGEMGVTIPIYIARTHIDIDGIKEEVVPTSVPDELKKKFRVMWASSGRVGTSILKDVFAKAEKLNDFKDMAFYVVANQTGLVRKDLYQYNIDCRYFEIMNIKQFLCLEASTDCLINPMHAADVVYVAGQDRAQLFVDCKSEVKFAHSGALNKPLITSPQSNYLYCCEHEKNSLVARTIDEWIQYLIDLKENPALRDKLAKNARKRVKKEYDTKVRAKEYLKLFANYEGKEDEEDNSSGTGEKRKQKSLPDVQ